MADKRVSRIKKSIKRIYNVAQYESLEIVVDYEEEIEWSDIAERQSKSNSIGKLLMDDFKKTRLQVFKELKESEKKAYFKNALESMGNISEDDVDKQLG